MHNTPNSEIVRVVRSKLGAVTITPAQTLREDRLSFPGLLPREVLIIKAWLQLHAKEYDSFDFNRRIGDGYDPGPGYEDHLRRMAVANTMLRLDAVGYKGKQPTIIEVKDRAGASAVGQLLTYEAVWLHDYPDTPAPKLILVTNRLQPNIIHVLDKSGVDLNVVQVDFSSLRMPAPYPGYKRGRST